MGQPIKKEVTPVIQENFMDQNSDFQTTSLYETAQYNSMMTNERKESTNYDRFNNSRPQDSINTSEYQKQIESINQSEYTYTDPGYKPS